MIVNGKPVQHEPGTLLEYLERHTYPPARVVVERAGEIITKEQFSAIFLQEDDKINILQFMGGG